VSGRALLIGVSEYDSDAIPNLDFVANDLNSLGSSLTGLGYEVTTLGGSGKRSPTHNTLIHEVTEFCRHGIQTDEVAILYFSGHGLHHQGRDYLVPADAQLGDELIEQMMVPVDFAAAYEQSRASAILFFIDACREGIDLGEKGALAYRQWSQGKLETIGSRQSAYVFACGPGEVSRFVPGTDGFSIFTRAFAETLEEHRSAVAMTFGRVRTAVQKRMDELADQNQRKRQNLRVVAEEGAADGNLAAVRIAPGGFRAGGRQQDLPSVDIEAIGDLTITSEDLKLLSYDQDAKPPWVGETIPVVHLLRCAAALEMPLAEVVGRLRRFEAVGLKVADIDLEAAHDLELDRDDLILLPSAIGLGQASQVSPIHLVYAASRLGKPLDQVLDSLRRFEPVGVTLPQIEPGQIKGLMVEREDLQMLSTDLDGLPPWLEGEVPITHVLMVSARQQQTVGEVIDKLSRFEPFGIEMSLDLDEHARSMILSEDDLRLLSQSLRAGSAWISFEIPTGHVMLIAHNDEQTLGEALRRLEKFVPLGWVVPDVTPESATLEITKEDLVIASRDFDGLPPWVDEVPATRLLAASLKFGESVTDVCERIDRFRGVGFSRTEVDQQAAAGLRPTKEDMVLVAGSQNGIPGNWIDDTIPVAHILYAAHQFDEPVEKVIARAMALKVAGIEVPEIDSEGAEGLRVSPQDLTLLSEDLDALQPWLDPGEVHWFHLLRATEALGCTVKEAVERIERFAPLGFEAPEVPDEVGPLQLDKDELIVLSRDLDGLDPWIGDEPVSVLHLLQASNQLEKPIGAILEILRPFAPLGIDLPDIDDPQALELQLDHEDLVVLSYDLDARAPWIEGDVPIGHILYAAATRGEDVGRVLDRLKRFEALGFRVPAVDERGARLRVTEEDLVLLSQDFTGHPPWVDREIPVVHLFRAAHALEEPIGETLQRLQRMELVEAITLTPYFAEPSRSWQRIRH
jgi:Caspase domain